MYRQAAPSPKAVQTPLTGPVFQRCLLCGSPFPENETLAHARRGGRLAYDPARGRLWIVCRACQRWSLTPLEQRWEALEELEKLVTDRAHLLSQTDNIALLRAGDVEIVRVGRADLNEESWWRYGRELRRRRMSYKRLSLVGTVATGAVIVGGWATGGMALVGAWWLGGSRAPERLIGAARWLRFGGAAWRGAASCAHCGQSFRELRYRDREGVVLAPDDEGDGRSLHLRCPHCGRVGDGGLVLRGQEADLALRRVLAYHHFDGASEDRIRRATRLLQGAGTPGNLERIVLRTGRPLGDLQRTGAVALEIAANEATEQRLLELELADLEAHWRQEEELASIIDGELTPLPLLEQLRRSVTGRG